jgi:hypothetical protein
LQPPADYAPAEVVKWDATRYANRLPKKASKAGTKASKKKEASLRRRYAPPLNGETVSRPCIIVDAHGVILTWYLPGILTEFRQVGLFALPDSSQKPDAPQNAMLAAREIVRPLLKPPESGSSWRDGLEHFYSGEGPQGSINFSPAWFPQAHDVSASAHRVYLSAA